jgi:hypothetical protein
MVHDVGSWRLRIALREGMSPRYMPPTPAALAARQTIDSHAMTKKNSSMPITACMNSLPGHQGSKRERQCEKSNPHWITPDWICGMTVDSWS